MVDFELNCLGFLPGCLVLGERNCSLEAYLLSVVFLVSKAKIRTVSDFSPIPLELLDVRIPEDIVQYAIVPMHILPLSPELVEVVAPDLLSLLIVKVSVSNRDVDSRLEGFVK
jgi:hypothetical protein